MQKRCAWPPGIRYFSAFYMAGDEFAFTSLWFSMALSTYGISTGLYLASHLTIVDLENEESDMKEDRDILSPTPRVLGQSAPLGIQPSPLQPVLPPPPGMGKPQTLPPPPGMGLNFFVPARSKRPGQFASDTEWFDISRSVAIGVCEICLFSWHASEIGAFESAQGMMPAAASHCRVSFRDRFHMFSNRCGESLHSDL